MIKLKPNDLFHDRYRLIRSVGSGGMSEVWEVSDSRLRDKVYAIKIYSYEGSLSEKIKEAFRDEFLLMNEFHHPNLLCPNYFDIEPTLNLPYMVVKLFKKGSASNIINQTEEAIDERNVAKFLKDAASALMTLHNHPQIIIHQDVKPDNFLIEDNDTYVLSDFGVSTRKRETRIIEQVEEEKSIVGDTPYVAPERFQKAVSKPAQDIFSLGVTLYEILTGVLPFQNFGGILLNNGHAVPSLEAGFGYTARLNLICQHCMQLSPAARPTASQLFEWANFHIQNNYWPSIPLIDLKNIQAEAKYKESKLVFDRVTKLYINELDLKEIDQCLINFENINSSTNAFPDCKQIVQKLQSLKKDRIFLLKNESAFDISIADDNASLVSLQALKEEYKGISAGLTKKFYADRINDLENKIAFITLQESKSKILHSFIQNDISLLDINAAQTFVLANESNTEWTGEIKLLRAHITKALKYQELRKEYEGLKNASIDTLNIERLNYLLEEFKKVSHKSNSNVVKDLKRRLNDVKNLTTIKRSNTWRYIIAGVIILAITISTGFYFATKNWGEKTETENPLTKKEDTVIKDNKIPFSTTIIDSGESAVKEIKKTENNSSTPVNPKKQIKKESDKTQQLKELPFEPSKGGGDQ